MELQRAGGGCLLTPEPFRDKQQWVYILSWVWEQEREGGWRNARESPQLIWVAEDVDLSGLLQMSPGCGQGVPADPSALPVWALLSLPLAARGWGCIQGLLLDAEFTSPSCQSRFTPTVLLLLTITIIMACDRDVLSTWAHFGAAFPAEGEQCSSALWCDTQVSGDDQAF